MYYTLYLMKYDNFMVGTVKDAAPSFFFKKKNKTKKMQVTRLSFGALYKLNVKTHVSM